MAEFAEWLKSWWEAFEKLMDAFTLTLFDLLKDAFIWIFKSVVDLAIDFFNQITDGASWDLSQYITALPPEVTQVMGALGLGNAMGIIASALLIRFLMGLVPFIRLGR